MALRFYKETRSEVVEAFLGNNFSAPTHWPEWNLAVSKYYHSNFYYLACSENRQLIGICPVHEQKKTLTTVRYTGPREFYLPFGGWLFSKRIDVDCRKIHLPFASAFTGFTLPGIEEFNADYSNWRKNTYLTLLLDLRKSAEKIWKEDISSKRRNMIRKAEKNNLQVVSDDKKDLSIFYKILKNSNSDYGLSTPNLEFFQHLFSTSGHVKYELCWAKRGEDTLGGLLLVMDKNYALYWMGFGIKETGNLGQGELLQWNAIQRAKNNGCTYYDLCSIEKERLPSIYEFKKDFAHNEVHNYFIQKRTFSYRVLNRLGG
jgi:hypothetical protein